MRFHEDDDDPVGVPGRGLVAAGVRQQQSLRRGKDRSIQSGPETLCRRNTHRTKSLRGRCIVLATAVHGEGDWVKAREIAQQGLQPISRQRRWPTLLQLDPPNRSPFGIASRPNGSGTIRCRRSTSVIATSRKSYLRVVTFDFEKIVIGSNRYQPEQLDQNQRSRPVVSAASPRLVGRSAGDRGFSGASRIVAGTGRNQKRIVLLDRQPQRAVQRQRQPGHVYRILGQRSGTGHAKSPGQGNHRRLCAEREIRRSACRRQGSRLVSRQQKSTRRNASDHRRTRTACFASR